MKNCNRCGAEIDEGAIFCPYCGSRYDERSQKKENTENNTGGGGSYDPKYGYIPNYSTYNPNNGYDHTVNRMGGSFWIAALSFFFPIVGVILWYMWKYTQPGKAASAAKGALVSVCFGTPLIGIILWFVWRHTRRELAKTCLIAGIIGAALVAIVQIVGLLLGPYFVPYV